MTKKTAVVLFNLGGPDSLESVQPFLFNLFNDPAIINLPNPFRYLLAKFISSRRAPKTQNIYKEIGNKSPLLDETLAQAKALEEYLSSYGEYKTFISMRYWHPFAYEAVQEVKQYDPDEIILLPLYPQFSTTTVESSLKDWSRQASAADLNATTHTVCCYPRNLGFIKGYADLLKKAVSNAESDNLEILFSAHGLPQKVIDKGDPYEWQVIQSAEQIMEESELRQNYRICYQSKVGPLKWLEPSTEKVIEEVAKSGKGIVLLPIAFVSEHSETLVELDIEYKELAEKYGAKEYIRVPTLSTHPYYIQGLADICLRGLEQDRVCPKKFSRCFRCSRS